MKKKTTGPYKGCLIYADYGTPYPSSGPPEKLFLGKEHLHFAIVVDIAWGEIKKWLYALSLEFDVTKQRVFF